MIHTHAVNEATSTWVNTMLSYTLLVLFGLLVYNFFMEGNDT
jgi:hypothetical protein